MTNPDPFETLESSVPFVVDTTSDPNTAAKKADMYEEILMQTETLTPPDATPASTDGHNPMSELAYRPKLASRTANRSRQLVTRVLAGAAVMLVAVLGATLLPIGGNAGLAVAAEAADNLAKATSGRVSVESTATIGGEVRATQTTFVFDGDNAQLSSRSGAEAMVVDGVGYLNQDQWFTSTLFDRSRLLGTFSQNLATTDGLSGLLELSESSSSTVAADGTEVIVANIRVDAGPGQSFDAAGFDNLPAGLQIAPIGNYDLIVTVEVKNDFVSSISWAAAGIRNEPGPLDGPGTIAEKRFRTSGSITYSGINEPQTIEAPRSATDAEGVDEWKLLDSTTRTGLQNLFTTKQLNPEVCGIDAIDTNLLIQPLTPTNTELFNELSDCLDAAGEISSARSIETLIDHRVGP